jgi:hypothetical protein
MEWWEEDEDWARVPTHPEYEVSTRGRARRGGHVLTPILHPNGRYWIGLWRGGVRTSAWLSRLVLTTFDGPSPGDCCHVNDNKRDNTLGNLVWASHLVNCQGRATPREH